MTILTVGVSDMKVSDNPSDTIVTRALGSCIAVVVTDEDATIAGMLHYQLPFPRNGARSASNGNPYMYADSGIPALLRAVMAKGASPDRLIVRLVGGSRILDPDGVFDIGRGNYLAARKILWRYGVLVAAEDVGGDSWRNVWVDVGNGNVTVENPTGKYPL